MGQRAFGGFVPWCDNRAFWPFLTGAADTCPVDFVLIAVVLKKAGEPGDRELVCAGKGKGGREL